MSPDPDAVIREVHQLHADLARWLGSEAPSEVFERFAAQQHVDFSMVAVSGDVVPRDRLLAGLRGARQTLPGLVVDVTDVELLALGRDCVVARFSEWHSRDGDDERRVVTATLLVDPEARNGLRWRAVHETAAAA